MSHDRELFKREDYAGWQHVDAFEWCRIFYKPNVDEDGSKLGFEAHVWIALSCFGTTDSPFDEDGTEGEKVMDVSAYYDGVRHVEHSSYLFHPNLQGFIKIYEQLIKLAEAHCNYPSTRGLFE